LAKQKLTDHITLSPTDNSDDDIDYDVAPLETSRTKPKKGKVEQVEWTEDLEALHREKVTADAARGMSNLNLASN
jgi:hypothetical protein